MSKYIQTILSIDSSIMSTIKIPKKVQKSRDAGIQPGDLVLFKLPSGDLKGLKVDKDTYVQKSLYSLYSQVVSSSTLNLGKVGSIHSDELIGQPYGLTYEIENKKLHVLPPHTLEEVGMFMEIPHFVAH